MRNAAMLMLFAAGCLGVVDDPDTATNQSNLVCDPWCDPSDPELQATLDGADRYAIGLFPDAVMRDQSCFELEPGTECLVMYSTAGSPCGPVTVDCTNFPIHGRNRVHCSWSSAGGCD
jgi:hypothetical protein